MLIDPADRVLLVRMRPRGGPIWCAPGGGVEAGESLEQAAARELAEETGLREARIGPLVWRRRFTLRMGDAAWDMRESYFLCRAAAFSPGRDGLLAYERTALDAAHWWTAAELAGTDERLAPSALPGLFAALLRDGPPETVPELGP